MTLDASEQIHNRELFVVSYDLARGIGHPELARRIARAAGGCCSGHSCRAGFTVGAQTFGAVVFLRLAGNIFLGNLRDA